VLSARIDGDLFRRVIDIVIALELGNDRLLERRDTVNGRILRHSVADRLNGGVLDEVWCVKIRLSGGQADDINAL
jgi:hypothetical protein